ncbi:hypothetical protein [Verrucomicrobium sp. BvORR106]|uniref:hypothetical protein n=1 Tax=Verrucomicrobium sp. BvORR106 TaxID=1403819 RepID=UPI00056F634E|nr:hypothetical protein [Verrucomicrobium sp. BvORR106]
MSNIFLASAEALVTLDGLMSGMIGVVVGAIVSWRQMNADRSASARSNMVKLLLIVGRELETTDRPVSEILSGLHIELLAGSYEVSRTFMWGKRRRWDETSGLLIGSMRTIFKGEDRPRHSYSYPSREDAKKHVEDMIALLGY